MSIRENLIDSQWPGTREAVLSDLKNHFTATEFKRDDVNDAFAALWTATRIFQGKAKRIPDKPEVDSRGLRMEMFF